MNPKWKKPAKAPRRRRAAKPQRALAMAKYNPQPVFTETFRLLDEVDPLRPAFQLDSNTGGVLRVRISQLPQIAQYKNLYTKYRILRATFICLPQFNTESSDLNAATYNGSIGLGQWGMARLVTSISDSPNAPAPTSEDKALQDNGCKIHTGKPKLVLSCRPVPDTLDAIGNSMTFRGKYLNFEPGVQEINHYGIKYWYTLPALSGSIQNIPYFVYCKLTFQLADPR